MSDKKCCNKPSIGGQAVIEGIMMKGPKKTVLAVRHITTGESIIEDVNDKITKLREIVGEDFNIEVDGGINLSNIKKVTELGANVIVAGSAVFKGDIRSNVSRFMQLMGSVR